jgi:hypothetical protein
MATIPNLAQQPSQSFQPSMNAEVLKNKGGVHLRLQKDPLTIKTVAIPHELMIQIIALWIQENPVETDQIMQAIERKKSAELDIIRTVQSSKNG